MGGWFWSNGRSYAYLSCSVVYSIYCIDIILSIPRESLEESRNVQVAMHLNRPYLVWTVPYPQTLPHTVHALRNAVACMTALQLEVLECNPSAYEATHDLRATLAGSKESGPDTSKTAGRSHRDAQSIGTCRACEDGRWAFDPSTVQLFVPRRRRVLCGAARLGQFPAVLKISLTVEHALHDHPRIPPSSERVVSACHTLVCSHL
jgi:hypothetical protein